MYRFALIDESDLDAVVDMAKSSLEEAWSRLDYENLLKHPKREHLGVYESSCLVGCVLALGIQKQTDLITVVVHSQKRKQGLGFLLLSEFKKQFAPEAIFLEVDPTNEAAVKLYLKSGFQVLGVRKKYYAGKRDAWSMRWMSEIV